MKKQESLHDHLSRSSVRKRTEEFWDDLNENPDLPIVFFNVDGMRCDTVSRILGRGYGIVTRPGLHCAPLIHQRIPGGEESVRASLSYLNTEEECRIAAEALLEVAGSEDQKIESA